ncbi:hypothetical protein OPV22_030603 [Ensete ventricosum]|uniref:Uncharacterized protein n=1 Tax=Ensete ventricosum TaxID=4639 RepID=A0AAV8QEJ0_ENSVE|nr:hypothetical protein OPV22_030603 [Ensete ventricosum]RWW00972.1 hypothetical protein GW17_00036023 [Ensete ventricosum]
MEEEEEEGIGDESIPKETDLVDPAAGAAGAEADSTSPMPQRQLAPPKWSSPSTWATPRSLSIQKLPCWVRFDSYETNASRAVEPRGKDAQRRRHGQTRRAMSGGKPSHAGILPFLSGPAHRESPLRCSAGTPRFR